LVAEVIPGFDQTKTDYDRTKQWKPFSDRKVRVGIVGHGVCQFALAFDLQSHPNVELVAVSDLFPDRCADMARKARCKKTYPSLEKMVKDDSIDAILRGRRPAVGVIDALNMTVPGYYAHLSARKDGETLKIPQYSLEVPTS
jgi:hypothetical protein